MSGSEIPYFIGTKSVRLSQLALIYLRDEGQFRPIRPEALIMADNYYQTYQEFIEEFQQTVLSPTFQKMLDTKNRLSMIHDSKVRGKAALMGKGGSRIHMDKMNYIVVDFLIDQGLARRLKKGDGPWYYFESKTALLYMSLLAKYIARTDKQLTTIGTDERAYERLNFQNSESMGNAVLSCDLKSLIPCPGKKVSLKGIVKFKNKRYDELVSFRNRMNSFQTSVGKAASSDEVKEIILKYKDDLRIDLKELSKLFKDSKIELFFKSLKSLVNIKTSGFVTMLGAIEKFSLGKLPLYGSASAAVITSAIEIRSVYIEDKKTKEEAAKKSDFSYLFYASKAGIIKPE